MSFKTLDRGIIELIGPYGLTLTINKLIKKVNQIQTGYVYHYAFIMLIGLLLFLTLIGLWNFLSLFYFIDIKLYFIIIAIILNYTILRIK